MQTDEDLLESLRSQLRRKVSQAEINRTKVKDPQIAARWDAIKQSIKSGDEVWDWSCHGTEPDGRSSASQGWCVMRNGKIIQSICWSFT